MPWDRIFELSSNAALAGWAVLVLAPRGWRLLGMAARIVVPGLLCLSYAMIVMLHFLATPGGFASIASVRQLFAADPMLVAGWQHYLAFDLIIGALVAERLDAAGVSRLVQAPVLLATFMLGPLGLVLGIAVEHAKRLAGTMLRTPA